MSNQVVFIDSRTPDIQDLLDGLKSDEQAFIINGNSDGLDQIVALLEANHLTDLSAISIVGHGASGEIDLGSTVIDDANLAGDAAALSAIGAAIAPGGNLALFACDTAAGPTGQQFIADLSHYAGGVDVAAATHLVGSSDLGASWTLDASTAAAAAPAAVPFTQNALAHFQGALGSPPVVTTSASALYHGGGAAQTVDPNITVTDSSSATLESVSVQIVGFHSGDTLNFTDQNNIHGSYNPANGVLSLTGHDTLGDYQDALRSITYSFAGNGDPTGGGANTSRSIYWVANDGASTNEFFGPDLPVNNDQPTLGLSQLVVLQGEYPTGSDGIPIAAIRTFAGDFAWGGTAEANGQPLSISQNAGLFSVLGTAYGGNGTSTFQLPNLGGRLAVGDDGDPNVTLGQPSGADSVTLTMQNMPTRLGGLGQPINNDQPSLAVNYAIDVAGAYPGGAATDVLGEVVPFLGNSAPNGFMLAEGQLLSISQYTALFTVLGTIYGGNGTTTFALPNLTGKTIIGAGSDGFNSVLPGTTTGQDSPVVAISNLPSPHGSGLPISNDQPSLALTYLIAANGIFPQQSGAPQANTAVVGEIIAFAGAGGALDNMLNGGWLVANGATLPIDQFLSLFQLIGTTYGGDGQTTFALPDLVGTAIAGTGLNPTQNNVSLGEKYGTSNITLNQTELPLPTVATSTVNVEHTAPTVVAGATVAFAAGGAAVRLDSALTVDDVDSGGSLAGATITIRGFVTGDTLNFVHQNGISGSYSAGVLTLTGSDTLAHYQTALESITFSSTDGTPGARTIDWSVTDGSTSNGSSATATSTVTLVPAIGSVTAATVGNITDLDATKVVTITVNFTGSVNVTGTPELQLNDSEVATYISGTGGTALTFSYTVQPNDTAADLRVQSLLLNGGTIKDGNGNDAGLANAPTDLHLQVDTLAPTVSVAGDHTSLLAGQTATVTFTFSEAVASFVLGDTTVSGGSLSNLVHVGINGSDQDIYTATFTPNVTNTEAGSVRVNAASYSDLAGNTGAASNTLSFTGDTLAPTVSIAADHTALLAGQSAVVTFTFSESVPGFVLGDTSVGGGALGNLVHVGLNGSNQDIYTATFTPAATNTETGSVQVTSASYADTSGNSGSASNTLNFSGDTLAPSLAVTTSENAIVVASAPATITFTFSEAVNGFNTGDVTAVGGAIGGLTQSGNPDVYTATFTPNSGFTGTGSVSVTANSYTDLAGNAGATGTVTFSENTLSPTATTVTATTDNGHSDIDAGRVVTITVNTSEVVTVVGTPTLALNDGESAAYFGGSGSNALVFKYTVQPGDTTSDLKVTGFVGTITDLVGNSLAAVTADLGIQVDTTAPTVSVAADHTALLAGQTALMTFTFS